MAAMEGTAATEDMVDMVATEDTEDTEATEATVGDVKQKLIRAFVYRLSTIYGPC